MRDFLSRFRTWIAAALAGTAVAGAGMMALTQGTGSVDVFVGSTPTPVATPAPLTANVWTIGSASPNGSCTRNGTAETLAAALSATRVCNPGDNASGALKAAAAAANTGDTIGVEDDAVYGIQTINGITKTLTFAGAEDARPTLRQIVMDDTSANLTFTRMDLSRSSGETNGQGTFSNGTGSGAGSDNIDLDDVTITSNYHLNKVAFFNEGSDTTVTDTDICCVLSEKLALIGGDHQTYLRVDWHDVYVDSESDHNECLYNGGSDYLLLDSNHFYFCQTVNLQNTRYCGGPGGDPPADGVVRGITVRNSIFEHTLSGIGQGVKTPWHSYTIGFVGNGLTCATPPAGDDIYGWVFVNNTIETTAPVSTDIDCQIDTTVEPDQPCVWANNVGNWSCGSNWTIRSNVGSTCHASDVAVTPSSSTASVDAAFDWTDPAGHDFHLDPGSPAIGVCDETYAPVLDKDGVTRGVSCDAGAYEAG